MPGCSFTAARSWHVTRHQKRHVNSADLAESKQKTTGSKRTNKPGPHGSASVSNTTEGNTTDTTVVDNIHVRDSSDAAAIALEQLAKAAEIAA